MPDLLLAVEGGGQRTRALLADREGRVLARGIGPAGNQHRSDFAQFQRALTVAIDGAFQQVLGPGASASGAGRRGHRVAAACLGLAGSTPRRTRRGYRPGCASSRSRPR